MSSSENDTDSLELAEDEGAMLDDSPDALFGCYSVLSPGVQIVLDGRAVSAPTGD